MVEKSDRLSVHAHPYLFGSPRKEYIHESLIAWLSASETSMNVTRLLKLTKNVYISSENHHIAIALEFLFEVKRDFIQMVNWLR
jgi:hypothetical protein